MDQPQTEAELYKQLLAENNGIAFGEYHGDAAAAWSVIDNIKTLKAGGVDTIYQEGAKEDIEFLATADLDVLVKERDRIIAVRDFPNAPENANRAKALAEAAKQYDNTTTSQYADRIIAAYDTALAARENGIRLMPIDPSDKEMQKIGAGPERVDYGNKEWVAEIQKDRQRIDPEGKGKYVVIGGYEHFNKSPKTNGIVDEKLGLVSVSPTYSNLEEENFEPVVKGPGNGSPDYWLQTGPHSYDLRNLDTIMRAEAIKQQLQQQGVRQNGADIDDNTSVKEQPIFAGPQRQQISK